MAIKQVNLNTMDVSLWLEGGYIELYLGENDTRSAIWSFSELTGEFIDNFTVNGIVHEDEKDELREMLEYMQVATDMLQEALDKK